MCFVIHFACAVHDTYKICIAHRMRAHSKNRSKSSGCVLITCSQRFMLKYRKFQITIKCSLIFRQEFDIYFRYQRLLCTSTKYNIPQILPHGILTLMEFWKLVNIKAIVFWIIKQKLTQIFPFKPMTKQYYQCKLFGSLRSANIISSPS